MRKLARISKPEPEPEPEEPDEEDEEVLLAEDPTYSEWTPTPLLYDISDSCFILGRISKAKLYRLIQLRKIHPIKLGTRSMFTMEELERFVSEQASEGATSEAE